MRCCPTCKRPWPAEQQGLPGVKKNSMPSRLALWCALEFANQVGLAPPQAARVKVRWAKALDEMFAEGWQADEALRLLRWALDHTKFVVGNPWQLRDKAHRIRQLERNQKAGLDGGELLA